MSKKRKWVILFSLIIGLPLLIVLGYGFHLYNSVTNIIEDIHQPIERELQRKVDLDKKQPLAVLLLGIDANGVERGRTDTLMVLTVNPNTNSMKMLSIPRDTRTEIIGKGFQDKINHAYAFGGPEMTIPTVENFLDIPIDYYITVNMSGFKDIIDAFGGVTVNNPFAFSTNGFTFDEGPIYLDGSQALIYSRMRKQDPRGDHGRNDRQRQIIQATLKEGAQISSIARMEEILNVIGTNVKTDVSFDHMKKLQSSYRSSTNETEEIKLSGSGATINKIWYFIVDELERQRVSSLLKAHLEIE